MGLFDIFGQKKPKVWISTSEPQSDVLAQLPEAVKGQLPNTTRPRRRVGKPTLSYSTTTTPHGGRHIFFEKSEYDLSEIARAGDTESYVRLAFDQLTARIMREPWHIKGNNDRTVAYVFQRIREMELATNKTFTDLLRKIVRNLVQYSNAFIVKVRSSDQSSGNVVRRYGRDLVPVVGLFSADPTSMEVRRDKNGNVQQWRQWIHGVDKRTFRRENVVHIAYAQRDGFAFGTPWIVPALDDIRALRRIEELTEILVGKFAFPLYHYKVGTEANPAQEFDNGMSEVDTVRAEIEYMPAEGAIVTPERHEIMAVNPSPVNIQPYLKYFEERVLTGLRVSSVDSGRGNTSNRSTAGFMRAAKDDLAKDMQDVLCDAITFFIFDEWLEEGRFPVTEENRVQLWWPPIDPEEQRLREAHAALMFQSDLLSETEARMLFGRQAITENQRQEMFSELHTKPQLEMQQQFKMQQQEQMARLRNVNQPQNQNGQSIARTRPANDELTEKYGEIKELLTRRDNMHNFDAEDLRDCGCEEEKEPENALDNISFTYGRMIDGIIEEFGEDALDMSVMEDGLDEDIIKGYRKKFLDAVSDARLTAAQRRRLSSTTFCGPGRSFPVNDCAHFTAALRLLPRFKGEGDRGRIRSCIMSRGRKLGCGGASRGDN